MSGASSCRRDPGVAGEPGGDDQEDQSRAEAADAGVPEPGQRGCRWTSCLLGQPEEEVGHFYVPVDASSAIPPHGPRPLARGVGGWRGWLESSIRLLAIWSHPMSQRQPRLLSAAETRPRSRPTRGASCRLVPRRSFSCARQPESFAPSRPPAHTSTARFSTGRISSTSGARVTTATTISRDATSPARRPGR